MRMRIFHSDPNSVRENDVVSVVVVFIQRVVKKKFTDFKPIRRQKSIAPFHSFSIHKLICDKNKYLTFFFPFSIISFFPFPLFLNI